MSISMSIGVDQSELRTRTSTEAREKAQKIATTAFDIAVANCPRASGQLASTAYLKDNGSTFEVGFSADYAEFVDKMPQSSLKNGKEHWLSSAVDEAYAKSGLVAAYKLSQPDLWR